MGVNTVDVQIPDNEKPDLYEIPISNTKLGLRLVSEIRIFCLDFRQMCHEFETLRKPNNYLCIV